MKQTKISETFLSYKFSDKTHKSKIKTNLQKCIRGIPSNPILVHKSSPPYLKLLEDKKTSFLVPDETFNPVGLLLPNL